MASEQAKRENETKFETLCRKGNNMPVSDEGEETKMKPSLEDIHGYRADAQQKSIEAVRAAEGRYNKAKEATFGKGQTPKESVVGGAQQAAELTREKGAAVKDTAAEKGAGAGHVAAKKGAEVKETVFGASAKAKEKAVDISRKAVNYAGEKAAAAKEATVEGGKVAARYSEVVADKAAAGGWTAAHYTAERAVEGTKAVAGTVEGAVEYAGHKAAEMGSKVGGATKEKAGAAAETVVGYTATKKEEADRYAQKKQEETHKGTEEEGQGGPVGATATGGETEGGGVLEAIGETIVEIAQQTKNIVIGEHHGDDDAQRSRDGGATELER